LKIVSVSKPLFEGFYTIIIDPTEVKAILKTGTVLCGASFHFTPHFLRAGWAWDPDFDKRESTIH
jgi:hypothetical protein